jgi:hypothetical protein
MQEDDTTSGRMTLLPIIVEETLVVDRQTVGLTPWGAPSVMGILGTKESDPSATVCAIAYESVYRSPLISGGADKTFLEFLYASRLRLDYALGVGEHLLYTIVPVPAGQDPPDLKVRTPAGEIGLECTRFTLRSRQAAHGLFRAVRAGILRRHGSMFSPLAAQVVYMWFENDATVLSLPPRRTDEAATDAIIEALVNYVPDQAALVVPEGELPEDAPQLPLHRTDAGVSFYSVPMTGSVPESDLFQFAGFELGLAYPSSHSVPDEWVTLRAQITRKDRSENDWLLISAGAPDSLGYSYPAEELVLSEMITHQPEPLSLVHLERVIVHFWSTGRVFEIHPDFREVSPATFSSSEPANRPFRHITTDS